MDADADGAVSALPPAFQAPEEAASRCRGASNTGGVKYSICTFCTSKASKLSTAPTCEQMQESIDYGRRQVLRWRQRQYSCFCTNKANKLSTSVHFCISISSESSVSICTVVLVKQVNFIFTCTTSGPSKSLAGNLKIDSLSSRSTCSAYEALSYECMRP